MLNADMDQAAAVIVKSPMRMQVATDGIFSTEFWPTFRPRSVKVSEGKQSKSGANFSIRPNFLLPFLNQP
jgi:hypothetical protein